jgi:hypothetical protein
LPVPKPLTTSQGLSYYTLDGVSWLVGLESFLKRDKKYYWGNEA